MLIPLNWLKDHLDTTADVETICNGLIQLGHEVEEVIDNAARFNGVVIGKVLEREQHPDADRLGVCKVDIGEESPKQIVCGAPNARAGITVAVATIGTVLPGDFKIKASKIRGVESFGMICAESELGLKDDAVKGGIWELETDLTTGTPLAEHLGSDTIIEIAITPNRGDCLSIHGVARELAALGLGTLKPLPEQTVGTTEPTIKATVETADCPFFSGIVLKGLKNTQSPSWMKQRLEAMGLQPRNALVDITNFIMFDLGQPLHAYDADKLQGNMRVINAKGGEEYKGIATEKTYTMAPEDIVIYDDSGLIDLCGITGSKGTAVSEETTSVYLEAAWFDRIRIAKTGQRLTLQTDARFRFERGIDPALTAYAARRAANLMLEICGGEASAQQTVGSDKKDVPVITFNPLLVKTFGGLEMSKEDVIKYLTALHFGVKDQGDTLAVTPPSFRTTMETPEDLVEELLRMAGYDAVPTAVLPLPKTLQNIEAPGLNADRKARRILAGAGFLEAMTYSFINHDLAEKFAVGAPLRELSNPIDEENMSTMRPSLLPGLLTAAGKNRARSEDVSHLFEVGKTFTTKGETLRAAALLLQDERRHWQGKAPTADAFAAKGQAIAVLAELGVKVDNLQIRTEGLPSHFHPGKSGILALGKNAFGVFGEIHPGTLKQFDLKAPVAALEIDLDACERIKAKAGKFNFSAYQPVTRDLAFVVDETLAAGDLLATVRNTAKDLARDVSLFDVYQGKGVPEGKKSLAVSVTLQSAEKTLSDEDINGTINAVVEQVKKHYGAELRE